MDNSNPNDIRQCGWVVAIHNDYKQNGVNHTFWLFTQKSAAKADGLGDGSYIMGEGKNDAAALNIIRKKLGLNNI